MCVYIYIYNSGSSSCEAQTEDQENKNNPSLDAVPQETSASREGGSGRALPTETKVVSKQMCNLC